MDFNSLAVGSPFYILQKTSEKPVLQIGTIKTKSEARSAYPTATPNILNGMNGGNQMVVDVVVSLNGTETPFQNLPSTMESTTYNGGNTYVSCSKEATLQVVDSMIQSSKKALEMVDYHKAVVEEGERMLESLNPSYAEGKKQARTIMELQEHVNEQGKKLDMIMSRIDEFFAPPKK